MSPTEIPLPDPPLVTDSLVLRPFTVGDFAAARDSREHPSSAEWVNALAAADGEALVRAAEAGRRAGRMLHLAIGAPDGPGYLGELILFLRTPEAGERDGGEIAYVVAPEARGRGVATDAVRLLAHWALRELGLGRIALSIRPDNHASRRVAEHCGFQYEGMLRSIKVIRGRRIDAATYSLLPSDVERTMHV